MIRLFYFIPIWIAFLLLRTALILLGWILVPIAAFAEAYEGEVKLHFTWKWLFPWDNYEDGIANDTYWKAPNLPLQIIYWSCFRNPVNNLRIVPLLSCQIDPERVEFIGSESDVKYYDTPRPQWFLCWLRGTAYSNFWVQFRMLDGLWRFWIGWKIYPTDRSGVTEYRKLGAGFATQFKRISD